MPILTCVRWHDVFFHTLPFVRTKGNTNRRQAESNHARMNCRGAKEENKRSAVKNRRGETISGSATAPARIGCLTALLKQSKDFRFFTLRRRGRPSSEIASAAGEANACVFCGSSEPCSSPPPHCGGLLSHSRRRRRTASNIVIRPGCGPRDAEASHSTDAPPCPMQTEQASPKQEYYCI